MPQRILPRRCAGRSSQFVSTRVLLSCTAFALMLLSQLPAAVAVTVSWNVDSDGFWDVPANWSTGMVPQAGQDVVIDRPAANVTVTFRSGTAAVNSLISAETFAMTGGTLELATTSSTATMTMSADTLGGARQPEYFRIVHVDRRHHNRIRCNQRERRHDPERQ